MRMDREEAVRLASLIGSQPKECFKNSAVALFASSEEGMVYVEGIAAILEGMLFIEHGWLQVGDRIIDVTLPDLEAPDYHPIFEYSRDAVMAQSRSVKTLPFYAHNRGKRDHMMNEQYRLYKAKEEEGK